MSYAKHPFAIKVTFNPGESLDDSLFGMDRPRREHLRGLVYDAFHKSANEGAGVIDVRKVAKEVSMLAQTKEEFFLVVACFGFMHERFSAFTDNLMSNVTPHS